MPADLGRRTFLRAVAAIAAVSAPTGTVAQTPIGRGGGARIKTSLNAYSFSKDLTEPGGMTLMGLLDFCAGAGFDAIDPTGYFFPGYPKVPSDVYVNEFKRRAFGLGLDISGTGVRNDFTAVDPARRAADVRLVRDWIECAARLGAPVIRVFAGPVPKNSSRDEAEARLVDCLGPCVEHGARYGVIVGVQNHGDLLRSADGVLEILKRVDSPWCGAIVDTGFFLTEDPYADLARMVPHAVNWQVKEKVGTSDPAISPPTDLRRLVSIVRAGGYRGYLPIETLAARGQPYDARARVLELLAGLRAALAVEG